MTDHSRRQFIKTLSTVTAGIVLSNQLAGCASNAAISQQKSVQKLITPKMDTVRIGIIGVGQRGSGHVKHLCNIEGVEIKAICDIDAQSLQQSLKTVVDKGFAEPKSYGGNDQAYLNLLAQNDIDIVIIATPWRWHTPMCVDTMNAGKHAFVEVPPAVSIEECWQLVDTSERTQKNCMMMENVCYGRDELMVLNMVQQGLFGELLHVEAAYIHELRWQMKEVDRSTGSWRTGWHTKRNGNLYPTHGLGPIAQYMNINRGDQFDYLTSMSSPAFGRQHYAAREFAPEHKRNQVKYINGDMNTSLIKTKHGRSIMVQHDTTTPRPYSRHNLIQGTKGVFAGFPNRIAVDVDDSYHKWETDMTPWQAKYDHPLWLQMGERALVNGGHGGMDFIMLWRMIYCLRNAVPLDQNVYDAAAWSAVTPLSELSVNDRSNAQDFPDFTRGAWKTNSGFEIKG